MFRHFSWLTCSALVMVGGGVLASSPEMGTLIHQLDKLCQPRGSLTTTRVERMEIVKRQIAERVAAGDAEDADLVRRRIGRRDATEPRRIGLTLNLLEAVSDWEGFPSLVLDLARNTETPDAFKGDLIGVVAVRYRSKLSDEQLSEFLGAVADSMDSRVRIKAIQHLLGFSHRFPHPTSQRKVSLLFRPINPKLGMTLLRKNALKQDACFRETEPFLRELLTRAADPAARGAYAEGARQALASPLYGMSEKLRYARQLHSMGEPEFDKGMLKRLEALEKEQLKNAGPRRITRHTMKNGKLVREEYADPTTMPSASRPASRPSSSP